MKVTPRTEDAILEDNLLPLGDYDFEVIESEDRVSKKGNEMIWLKLNVFASNGRNVYVFDYLLDALAMKINHACNACGLMDKYNAGTVKAIDFLNKSGKARVGIRKDDTGQYAPSNTVIDYIKRTEQPEKKTAIAEDLNDDIPWT